MDVFGEYFILYGIVTGCGRFRRQEESWPPRKATKAAGRGLRAYPEKIKPLFRWLKIST
jgi:hypothetical protein